MKILYQVFRRHSFEDDYILIATCTSKDEVLKSVRKTCRHCAVLGESFKVYEVKDQSKKEVREVEYRDWFKTVRKEG